MDVRAAGGRFSLPGAAEFASELNMGQIIKGKVLRQYEGGGRYLVNFDGRERVVDSGIPLTTGELIHGRVIGLGDRVELQRVYSAEESVRATEPPKSEFLPTHAQAVEEMALRYRAALDGADRNALVQAAQRASDPNTMVLAGITLNKMGLRQSPELLWPVYRALQREDALSAGLHANRQVLQVEAVVSGQPNAQLAGLRQLAETLAKQIEDGLERPSSKDRVREGGDLSSRGNAEVPSAVIGAIGAQGEQERGGVDPRQLARWLLNTQTEGAVAHRLGTVPFLFGNQLIEVDLSFFEQNKEASRTTQTQHRKIVFSLRTEHLGTVQIAAHVSGTHVRLEVATDNDDATAATSAHAQELRAALSTAGWDVDEVMYQTSQTDSQNGVVRSVVEHIISQDSLSRLI